MDEKSNWADVNTPALSNLSRGGVFTYTATNLWAWLTCVLLHQGLFISEMKVDEFYIASCFL